MTKTPSLKELRGLSLDELISHYDFHAVGHVVGPSFYLQEIVRRESAETTERIAKLTRQMLICTWLIFVFTLFNVVSWWLSP